MLSEVSAQHVTIYNTIKPGPALAVCYLFYYDLLQYYYLINVHKLLGIDVALALHLSSSNKQLREVRT